MNSSYDWKEQRSGDHPSKAAHVLTLTPASLGLLALEPPGGQPPLLRKRPHKISLTASLASSYWKFINTGGRGVSRDEEGSLPSLCLSAPPPAQPLSSLLAPLSLQNDTRYPPSFLLNCYFHLGSSSQESPLPPSSHHVIFPTKTIHTQEKSGRSCYYNNVSSSPSYTETYTHTHTHTHTHTPLFAVHQAPVCKSSQVLCCDRPYCK